MKGLVLVFNDQKNVGAIATPAGQRYLFAITDWKEELTLPERGQTVEFEEGEENRARNVVLALPEQSAPPASPTASATVAQQPYVPKPKQKSVLTLLAIFLGICGAHKFYMDAWGWGIAYLLCLFFVLGLVLVHPIFEIFLLAFGVLVLVEWVRYILLSDAQFEAKLKAYQAQRPGPFAFFW